MKSPVDKIAYSLAVVGCLFSFSVGLAPAPAPAASSSWSRVGLPSPVKIGYWPSYSSEDFPLSALNASLFTHLMYAFADLDGSSFTVEVEKKSRESAMEFSGFVKQHNPHVKTLLSIGGGSSNKSDFSRMARESSSRQAFINSSIGLARRYSFDGLDLDWEFPGSAADMGNLGLVLSELRLAAEAEAFSSGAPALLLTAAVYYSAVVENYELGTQYEYPVESIARNLDWVGIMCYDYHGKWEKSLTGEHTALDDPKSNLSSRYGIGTWLGRGLPPYMAAMGLAIYGHSWRLASTSETWVGAPATGPGPVQPQSGEAGIFYFFEVEEFVRKNNATVVNDASTGSAYCYAGDVWIGYDNEESIARKVEFLMSNELRGYFFWTASFDKDWVLSRRASETLQQGVRALSPAGNNNKHGSELKSSAVSMWGKHHVTALLAQCTLLLTGYGFLKC